jgi:beta-lactamase class C
MFAWLDCILGHGGRRVFISIPIRPLVLTCAASVAAATVARAMSDGEVERLVAQEIAPTVADRPGGAAVAVLIEGRTLFFNYGLAAATQPVTQDSLFPIASVRKVFDVTLLARGVLDGALRLDDPVARHVPELEGGDVRRITIGQLATHTSGLLLQPDYPPWPERRITFDKLIAMANAWRAEVEPGTRHTYTHAGFVLLQLALARRYAAQIDRLLAERVFKPLGLSSTVLPEHRLGPPLLARAVQGYGEHGEPFGKPGDAHGFYDIPGSGQVFSSARDLARFVAASLGREPIDPVLQAALRLTQQGTFRVGPRIMQAMAYEVNDLGPTVIDKPGGVQDASSYIGFVPDRGLGLVILANRGERHVYEIGRRLLPALAKP